MKIYHVNFYSYSKYILFMAAKVKTKAIFFVGTGSPQKRLLQVLAHQGSTQKCALHK